MTASLSSSGIRDNYTRDQVVDFLKDHTTMMRNCSSNWRLEPPNRSTLLGVSAKPWPRWHEFKRPFHDAVSSSARTWACSIATRDALRPDSQLKNIGMKIVAIKVAASIPPNTPVPIERRAADPAPVEMTR